MGHFEDRMFYTVILTKDGRSMDFCRHLEISDLSQSHWCQRFELQILESHRQYPVMFPISLVPLYLQDPTQIWSHFEDQMAIEKLIAQIRSETGNTWQPTDE